MHWEDLSKALGHAETCFFFLPLEEDILRSGREGETNQEGSIEQFTPSSFFFCKNGCRIVGGFLFECF